MNKTAASTYLGTINDVPKIDIKKKFKQSIE